MELSGNIGGTLKLAVYDVPRNRIEVESDTALEAARNSAGDFHNCVYRL